MTITNSTVERLPPATPVEGLAPIGTGEDVRAGVVAMLRETPLFGDLAAADLEALAGYVEVYEAAANTVLFREGESGGFMCLLVRGGAEIVKQDRQFGARRISHVGPGKTLGEMALIDGEPRSATCIFPQRSELALLTRERFVRLLREQPQLGIQVLLKIVTLMSRRLRKTSAHLVDYLQE